MVDGETWDTVDLNGSHGTPDGVHRFIEGDTENPDTAIDDVLAVGGVVVLREGSLVPGSSLVLAEVIFTRMAPSGWWYSRGDDPNNDDWAVVGDANAVAGPRTGAVAAAVAVTGDPIDGSGSGETWGDALGAFNGNSNGLWVLAGNTSAADPFSDNVIVLNGQRVVVREGDPVDIDGNGLFDDDAFIGRGNEAFSSFAPNDLFLTDDMQMYFIAHLRDGAGNDLGEFGTGGDAFLRLDVSCPADITGPAGDGIPDGNVDALDYLLVIGQWGSPCTVGGCEADFTGPRGVPDGSVDSLDFLALIAQWGSPGNCPPSP
jgi:hypothetical protein